MGVLDPHHQQNSNVDPQVLTLKQVTRLHTLEMGGGGLLDCGMYVITIASWAFGTQKPSGVNGYGAISHNGVDVAGCVNLKCVASPGMKPCQTVGRHEPVQT